MQWCATYLPPNLVSQLTPPSPKGAWTEKKKSLMASYGEAAFFLSPSGGNLFFMLNDAAKRRVGRSVVDVYDGVSRSDGVGVGVGVASVTGIGVGVGVGNSAGSAAGAKCRMNVVRMRRKSRSTLLE